MGLFIVGAMLVAFVVVGFMCMWEDGELSYGMTAEEFDDFIQAKLEKAVY